MGGLVGSVAVLGGFLLMAGLEAGGGGHRYKVLAIYIDGEFFFLKTKANLRNYHKSTFSWLAWRLEEGGTGA